MTMMTELAIKKEEFQEWLGRMGFTPPKELPVDKSFLFIQDELDWPHIQNVGAENSPTFEDPVHCTYPECNCKESLMCDKFY